MSGVTNDPVARQYERWVYPLPIQDLSAPPRVRNGGDFARHWHVYWPDQARREDIDVLVAGCGSNAAALYAYNHPRARVVGIDLSSSSLAHEQHLKEKHALTNLSLYSLRLEDVARLEQDFDFIDCTGVLHHLPDPVRGLDALGTVLKPSGTIFIMVYGQYRRTGVYMLQDLFRMIALDQTPEDLQVVKDTLNSLQSNHPARYYSAGPQRDFKFDAGIVDTFLHPQDRAYTVPQCLELADQAGLSFMRWSENLLYYPDAFSPSPVTEKIAQLPEPQIWEAMELLNGTLGQHAFCVCRRERDSSSYTISFDDPEFGTLVAIPQWNTREEKDGKLLLQRRSRPAYAFAGADAEIIRRIDGTRPISECCHTPAGGSAAEAHRQLFRRLWRLDLVAITRGISL